MKVFYVTLYLLFVLSLTAKAQDSVKVALVQAHLAWGDVDANLRDFDKRVRSCKGCDMIVFPELFTSGCEMKKRDKEEAVCSKDGVASYYPLVIKRMRKWAKRSGALVVGSTIYKEEGKYYPYTLSISSNLEDDFLLPHKEPLCTQANNPKHLVNNPVGMLLEYRQHF